MLASLPGVISNASNGESLPQFLVSVEVSEVKCGVSCRLPGAFLCQYEEVPGFSFIKIFTVGKSYISLFPLSALIAAISFLIPAQH